MAEEPARTAISPTATGTFPFASEVHGGPNGALRTNRKDEKPGGNHGLSVE